MKNFQKVESFENNYINVIDHYYDLYRYYGRIIFHFAFHFALHFVLYS